MKQKASYTKKTRCTECRKHGRKYLFSENLSICTYCKTHNLMCLRYKPGRAELEITKLRTEIRTLEERVNDLETRVTDLEKDNSFFRRNFLQRKLLDDQLTDLLE
jgi:cell division protein FtsB